MQPDEKMTELLGKWTGGDKAALDEKQKQWRSPYYWAAFTMQGE